MQENRLDLVKKEFIKYLDSLGLSPKSHKNYRSDLNHFLSWMILKLRSYGSYIESLTDTVPFLKTSVSNDYKSYMLDNHTPLKTVNRRLSTLRHLAKFLLMSQAIDTNFMEGVENTHTPGKKKNIDPVLHSFKSYLESEKVSENTIKNYLSDVKQFMAWLEAKERSI